MKKHIALYAIVAAALIAAPDALRAQTTPPTTSDAPAATAPVKKKKGLSVSGKTTAIDTTAMTITVKDQTFNITSTTKILKNEKATTLGEIKVGEMVRVIYKKDASGTLNATTIHVGDKVVGATKTE